MRNQDDALALGLHVEHLLVGEGDACEADPLRARAAGEEEDVAYALAIFTELLEIDPAEVRFLAPLAFALGGLHLDAEKIRGEIEGGIQVTGSHGRASEYTRNNRRRQR